LGKVVVVDFYFDSALAQFFRDDFLAQGAVDKEDVGYIRRRRARVRSGSPLGCGILSGHSLLPTLLSIRPPCNAGR